LAAKVQLLETKNAAACSEADGWLFLAAELRLLSLGRFWGEDAAKVSRSHKRELADPFAAIVDFHQQLKAHGIELLLVPVPPKAAIYPEKILPSFDVRTEDSAPFLHRFYGELRSAGIEVLDPMPMMIQKNDQNPDPFFCKTDTHWSGVGCVLAAHAIAEKIREKIAVGTARRDFLSEWREAKITGDLIALLPADAQKPGPERIRVRRVTEKGSDVAIEPDRNSPVLLLGDSYTLVFHDFLSDRSGLLDQLAFELGTAPDLIGTRGSGATPVRISLYRASIKDPNYLAKKRIVVWCFGAREFSEASEGWAKIPVAK
jgi:alginate O-acetyltransferase complex protein AlgJ